MPHTVPGHVSPGISTLVVKQCLELAAARGVDVRRMLSESGFREEWLNQPGDWLSFLDTEPMLRRGLELMNDPLAGLHGTSHITLTTFGVMGFVAQTSSTLRDLIEASCRFERLISDVGTTSLRHEPGTALWQWECSIQDPVVARHATECILGCWLERMQLMRQRRPRSLLAVHFRHAIPDERLQAEYENFFGCPVHFCQAESALVLPPSLLAEPLSLADPELHRTLKQHAQQLLQARQAEHGIIEQTRNTLRHLLAEAQAPSREALAQRLGMSGRSLHRKLEEAGSSYRELLDALRLEKARDALGDRALSVEAVSQLLGFQESQSFIRWFKRLEGTTPGEFRQRGSA